MPVRAGPRLSAGRPLLQPHGSNARFGRRAFFTRVEELLARLPPDRAARARAAEQREARGAAARKRGGRPAPFGWKSAIEQGLGERSTQVRVRGRTDSAIWVGSARVK